MTNLKPIQQAIAKFNKSGFTITNEATVNDHNTFSLKVLISHGMSDAEVAIAEVVFYHNPSTNSETRFSASVNKLTVTELSIEDQLKQHLEVIDFVKDLTSASVIDLVKSAAINATKDAGKKYKKAEAALSKDSEKVKSTTAMATINHMIERVAELRGDKKSPVTEQEAQINLVASELQKTGNIIEHVISVSMDKRIVFKIGKESASKAATLRSLTGMWISKSEDKYSEITAK
ncbi:hypothetical protein OTK49_20685 [Vibrio coralliirubri]|uniref:hypothetical protein n=1 Tax=Vibrio coralliirubri TaxID=1516159 RepID=UPI0022853495|nr:hypothetical protein [Vibrio coralliirubri]MCY9864935.1 hypothetical protein [Vibrio coralliirubri]